MDFDPRKEQTVWGASSLLVLPWKSWRILQLIGEGSFGTVYEAVKIDGAFDERCAVKHIPVPKNRRDIQEGMQQGLFSTDSGARLYYAKTKERIINEIRLMQRFSGHSHVVNYHDYEIVERQDMPGYDIYIRMELLHSLPEFLSGVHATDTETTIIKLGMDICDALKALHQKKIIHRDIKPANILHGETGFKLADFGVARSLDATGSMTVAGTLGYMPPEIYKHLDSVNQTSDIYSLGLVMYRLLNDNRMPFLPTGRDIVVDESMQTEAMGRRMKGEPLPPIPGVSPYFMGIIIKACSYEATSRYSKAGEMFEALEGLARRPGIPPQDRLAVNLSGVLTKAEGNYAQAIAEIGDTITYSITVQNTGHATISDAQLIDSNHRAFETTKPLVLQAGETADFEYSYKVSLVDIHRGSIFNRIVISGKSPTGAAVTATAEHTFQVAKAQTCLTAKCLFRLLKAVGNLHAQAAQIGDIVEYTITVTNVGTIAVDHLRLHTAHQNLNAILRSANFELKPGEVWSGVFQQKVEPTDVAKALMYRSIAVTGVGSDGTQVTTKSDVSVPVFSAKQSRRMPMQLIIAASAILIGLGLIIFFNISNGNVSPPGITPTPFAENNVATLNDQLAIAAPVSVVSESPVPTTEETETPVSSKEPLLVETPIPLSAILRYDSAELGYWDDSNAFISHGSTVSKVDKEHQLFVRFTYTNIGSETFKESFISVCYPDENTIVAYSNEPWELTPGSADQFTINVQGGGRYYLYVNGELIGSTDLETSAN